MKKKRKESCPSPILDDSPKRTKVQAQRKFAQNSGVHSPIITPIRDLETADLPHTSVLPEPVELLPMKRPNTEDFLTFLCFRGTPILPPSLQFFNTASIVADGQVHEIKGDSPKNGPIDIAKCAGSSSEKPFIAFGVRKRADPIVISKQMEKKRRHALAIQALRRKYQEQKMAKIRALTISKLSEKTTNKTLVKTNTIQKTETVTKKTNTLQKTKVIATKHVKVTTQTLKTNVKPRMCLRSFRGQFVQKELPFRARRPLVEKDAISSVKNVALRTSRNSNKIDGDSPTIKRLVELKKPKVVRPEPLGSIIALKRPQIKRRILLPSTMVTTIVKPKLRSTTMKKSVISRRKAQQRLRASINKNKSLETFSPKETINKPMNELKKKDVPKKTLEENIKKTPPQDLQKPSQEISRRLTRKDSCLLNKDKPETRKEIVKNLEVKREVKIAESGAKKMVKKNVNVKREFNLKTNTREVKKNLAVQKTSDSVSEKSDSGQKITRDVKTIETTTVKKVITRKSEDTIEALKKSCKSPKEDILKKPDNAKKTVRNPATAIKETKTEPPKKKPSLPKKEEDPDEEASKRTTRESTAKKITKEEHSPKKAKEHPKKEKIDQEFSKKIQELIDTALKEAEELTEVKCTTNPNLEEPLIEPKQELPVEQEISIIKNKDNESESLPPSEEGLDSLPIKSKIKEEPVLKEFEKEKISPKEDITIKKPSKLINKEDNFKRNKPVTRRDDSEHTAPLVSSRPTRKTKEAAAIYMEILSHKLVNESTIDDDNVSIDSFPELPNVKKTEQREIELKAQAKTTKEEAKIEPTRLSNPELSVATSEASSEKLPAPMNKRKSNPITIASDDDSDNEVLQAKIRKCEAQKSVQQEPKKSPDRSETSLEGTVTRRQTRRCTQIAKDTDSDSSDESFHVDIRVPKKKKVTRSRNKTTVPQSVVSSVLEKNVDIILEAARVLEAEKSLPVEIVVEDSSKTPHNSPIPNTQETKKAPETFLKAESDSDESTTSDINLKCLQVKQRNKKLSKTKSSKSSAKSAANFSDSDEEPLVKFATKSVRSVSIIEDFKKKPPEKQKAPKKVAAEITIMEPKPKRECTKRPSNYLPMLSSSDEDDESYFHGFNTSKEELNKPKVFVQSLAPSLDLLNKNIGRKGKVNMSNEQIEQWLKDSALAGSSVAKENDAMLKFGEKIPAEIPKGDSLTPVSAPVLKLLDSEEAKRKVFEPQPGCSKESDDIKPKMELKSPLTDRKWIFKKDKKEMLPNKNAFSPENECSVYAFGEDNEDVVSTPFRRPSRRPSSTATSRSEDELSKNEDSSKQGTFRKPNPSDSEDSRCFNIPQNPAKLSKTTIKMETMVPPSSYHSKRQVKPTLDKFPEPFDDYKYKIPSSPSASSGSSAKLYKRGNQKSKGNNKAWESINPVYVSDFPKPTDPAKLVEAPVFQPTDQEFQDPLEYIERIRHKAEQFGICKIVPPSTFKPECKVSDDMRFTAYNQYVHKMLHRWGPNFKEFIAIRKYLATQSIFLKTPPLIGGMEIDLPRLYQTVQSLGGLKEVIEKKKWSKVSDQMKIPKSAQDRVTKLDDIYCKYLLPYDTLSPAEREKLFDEVETYWAKKESKNLADSKQTKTDESSEQDFYDSDDNDTEECTLKGKNMALNAFYRIARNTMSMYFKVTEPTALEVEQDFWRYVTQKQNHICVHSASIDCGTWGYGFAVSKNSPFARHPWNLKVLSNNNGSVLRSLGPVMGVTIPTLHVGMVFSACCWYRDPHGLPWVEYLHTGGNKIWYGIPSSSCEVFHAAMQKMVPNYCRDKELWLPSDTAMVPPGMLIEHNVSLCRTIQEPGQFIVVFPKVFTSSLCTGYVVSESVYFASLHWLRTARNLFNDLKTSCEPSMFSLDKLLISIVNDNRSTVEVLRVILPFIEDLCVNEKLNRIKLRSFGKIEEEKVSSIEPLPKKKKIQSVDGDFECEICRMNLFVSMVLDTQDDLIYCLEDAVRLVAKSPQMIEKLMLKYCLDESDLDKLPTKINGIIDAKLQKKVPSKFAGMPTLLK